MNRAEMDAAIREAREKTYGPLDPSLIRVSRVDVSIYLRGMRDAARFADMPEKGGHPLAAVIAKHIRAAADELENAK